MQPLVSIIIPNYNRAHLIGETLDSVIGQTYSNWECIVVDDGSTDYTGELMGFYCSRDSRIQYHHRPEDKIMGANACRNYGFTKTRGKYLNWLDSDDLLHPEKLALQVKALEEGNYDFSVCSSSFFEKEVNNVIYHNSSIWSPHPLKDHVERKIKWFVSAPLWKKEFLKDKSLFDEKLKAAQEWEFHCRILLNCEKYHYLLIPLMFIRKHNNSITYNQHLLQRQDHYLAARKKVDKALKAKGIYNNYLQNYFITYYKKNIREGDLKRAFVSLVSEIVKNKGVKSSFKIKMILAFFSYILWKKGDVLFRGDRFK